MTNTVKIPDREIEGFGIAYKHYIAKTSPIPVDLDGPQGKRLERTGQQMGARLTPEEREYQLTVWWPAARECLREAGDLAAAPA